MANRSGIKADPGVWLPLLSEYRIAALAEDFVLEGVLRDGLDASSPQVIDALHGSSAPAYLERRDGATRLVVVYGASGGMHGIPWVHVCLFLATLLTTLASGAFLAGSDPFGTRFAALWGIDLPVPTRMDWRALWGGAPFAIPFLGVLLAHEMGHYLAARVHRVRVSLPYFIPVPPYLSVIGTLGAFIRLRGPTVRRSVLFDIGAAGPWASFLLSIPLLLVGLAHSRTVPGQATLATPFVVAFAGEPIWLGGSLAVNAAAGLLLPGALGEAPVLLHPVALAGWLGLFVTALNLLPLGQLDGGHVLFALDPEGQRRHARRFLLGLLPLGLVWWGWWGWVALILLFHRGRVRHPPILQPETDPGGARKLLGMALILIFVMTFVPVPIRL